MARRKRERLSAERWSEGAVPVWTELVAWREAHPRATFSEIEAELDRQLTGMRARILGDLALVSATADLQAASVEERPRCERCGAVLQARGASDRALLTHGGAGVRLRRTYAACPTCGDGSFPPG